MDDGLLASVVSFFDVPDSCLLAVFEQQLLLLARISVILQVFLLASEL